MTTIVLDLAGLKCPLPALRTRKALADMASGQTLTVHCTDPMAAIDIPHLINETGNRLIDFKRCDGTLTFLIEKSSI